MDCELLKILQGSDILRIIAWKLLFIIFSVTSEDAGFKVKNVKVIIETSKMCSGGFVYKVRFWVFI